MEILEVSFKLTQLFIACAYNYIFLCATFFQDMDDRDTTIS